ncbi:AAA family ATPase [Chryseobacterium arthrosphaerae]|uniref:AAA family ATPase n=1 Tax=Chryseobacterium arthrosphaerae TaxID=651561 RepID=UPI001BB08571|nr:AAA family ATPase [Chryseobacterium arthrosphaerae]QUY53875.1 AAA family ATPase [Chryseobacterium arthrosphaerae]
MNSLEFKHFRKFENFRKISFNDITFLVGKNNSGKSTFVKAYMLILNYLKSDNLKSIDFNQGTVETLNIVTFDRALCKTMTNKAQKENISFTLQINDFEFSLTVTGKQDNTEADVLFLSITDQSSGFTLKISPKSNEVIIEYHSQEHIVSQNDILLNLHLEKAKIIKALEKLEDNLSTDSIELNSQLQKINKNIEMLLKDQESIESSFVVSTSYSGNTLKTLFKDINLDITNKYKIQYPEEFKKINIESEVDNDDDEFLNIDSSEPFENNIEKLEIQEEFEDLRYFYINRFSFQKFSDKLLNFLQNIEVVYLSATLNKQAALFSIREKNNPVAMSVFQYHQLELKEDPIINAFINKWFKIFQIGEAISINMVEGEAFAVNIISGDSIIPLADKGMGSIQAALLILRIASVIYKKKKEEKRELVADKDVRNQISEIIIIIEEPELNLHPALQSKLCDLFFEVHEKYNVKFIIETHSEYVIRKTQLFVKQESLEVAPNENPFAVLYFNDDLNAWNMEYREDGKFKNDFGSGFFDETRNIVKQML